MSVPKARFTSADLEAIGWTFCAVAIVLTFLRYAIRLSILRRLLLDDLFHFLGLSCFIAMLATYQYLLPYVADFTAIDSGRAFSFTNQHVLEVWYHVRSLQLAGVLLFATGISMIRFAYLTLYYIIFNPIRAFRIPWYIITVTLFLFWIAAMLGIASGCGTPQDWWNIEKCESPAQLHYFVYDLTTWAGVLSVVCDFLVVCLPVWFVLTSIQLSRAKAISLSALFSLGLIVTSLDIARIVVSILTDDFSLCTAFQYMMLGLAVIISCVPPLAAFFHAEKRARMSQLIEASIKPGGGGGGAGAAAGRNSYRPDHPSGEQNGSEMPHWSKATRTSGSMTTQRTAAKSSLSEESNMLAATSL